MGTLNTSSGKRRGASRANRPDLLDFFEKLLTIRIAEERLQQLFADGEVPGFIHLSIGQEAVSVGVMSALNFDDTIASTHRGHGHAIAKGMPLSGFFAELLAKENGVCRGRGGSMHVADMSIGMLGANGIVGAGPPIALGSALAHRTLGTGQIAVSFFGDGALAEGVVHESLNIAALWKLPILFVCEANGWSEFSPADRQIAFNPVSWAESYGLRYRKVDGNDVVAVVEAAQEIIREVRLGNGPALLECVTSRVRGHYEGDAQRYRTADEAPARDPIDVLREHLTVDDVSEAALAEVMTRVRADIEAAITAARAGDPAEFNAALADVYTGEAG